MKSECPSCHFPLDEVAADAGDSATVESQLTKKQTLTRCPNCGAILQGLDTDALSMTTDTSPGPEKFAHFQLRRILGQGGFGTVWLADDLRLERRVALKLPRQKPGNVGDLLREAKTAAKLRHPNIVSVHEVGEINGQVYIVCEFIDGMDLRTLLRKGAIPESRVIDLLQATAAGLHHAHENQIVHRDMKPANVLVDESGNPLVTDFGLAKNIDIEESISSKGKIVGTVMYMAPEQASAERDQVDRRADIYALGVIMYEMLTGERPFRGDLPAIIRQKESEDPAPLRQLRPSIPLDLETICLKCLQRSPPRRYETAIEFSEELQRYRDGLPILARPISNIEYAWRWCLRNRAVATLLLLLFLSLSIGLAGTTIFWVRARDQTEQVRRSLYASQMTLASSNLFSGDTEATRHSLDRFLTPQLQHFRGFEWYFLSRELQRFRASVQQKRRVDGVAISREGDWFATVTADRMMRLWNGQTGELIREVPSKIGRWQCVAISNRDNQVAAGAKDGTVYLWQAIHDESSQPRVIKHGPGVLRVKYSGDGTRLFTAGGRGAVRVWDASTLERIEEIPTGQEGMVDFAVSKDGSVLVTAGEGGMMRAWDVNSRQRLCEVFSGNSVKSVAVSSDGERFVAGTIGSFLMGYLIDGSESFTKDTPYDWISDIAFLDSSPVAAICSSRGAIAFFDCDNLHELRWIETHDGANGRFAVSAKAQSMVVGAVNGSVKVLDIRDCRQPEVMGGDQPVRDVCLLGKGDVLVAYGDGSVHRLGFADQTREKFRDPAGRRSRAIATSRPASLIAIGNPDSSVDLLDAGGQPLATIPGNGSQPVALRFNATGDELLIAEMSGSIRLFKISPQPTPVVSQRLSVPFGSPVIVEDACLSEDGRRIAIASREGPIRFINVANQSWEKQTIRVESAPASMSFAGEDLVVGTRDGFLIRFDDQSMKPIWKVKANLNQLNKIAVIPGGDAVATVGGERELQIWDLVNGDLRFSLLRHQYQIFAITTSDDGGTLVTGGLGGDVRIWRSSLQP